MPAEHSVDPQLLDALASELRRSSTAALDTSHELLAHYSDTGSAPLQRAVDTLIDHAADALRALTDSLADISAELETAAQAMTASHDRAGRSADAVRSLVAPRSGGEHRG
jgi:ABC-type transporter Mla subunit MlaD